MKTLCHVLLAAGWLFAGLAQAQESAVDQPFIVYSTLSPAGTFNSGTGYTLGGSSLQAVANRFVPASDGAVLSIDFSARTPVGPRPVTVQLLLDDGFGLPGAVLTSGTVTVSTATGSSDNTTMTSFVPGSAIWLSHNTAYWVAVLPQSTASLVWTDSLGTFGTVAAMGNSFPWGTSLPTPSLQQGLRILAVPEPSAMFIWGLAGIGVMSQNRRYRTQTKRF